MLKGINYKIQMLINYLFPRLTQKIKFRVKSGYFPSNEPLKINEIIFKLKTLSSTKDNKYVDKYLARGFISEIIKKHNLNNLFLPELLVVSPSVKNLKKNLPLPKCFIKANHGSGMCYFYNPIDHGDSIPNKMLNEFNTWLNVDYSLISGEKCYQDIKRLLLCESPLYCSDGSLPDDIKVHCYFGQPSVIQVLRRTSGKLERKTYDKNWVGKNWFRNEVLEIDTDVLPKDNIIDYSRILSQPFKYVRVDFYLVDQKLYFSELTLYPASASLPLISEEVELELGGMYNKYREKR